MAADSDKRKRDTNFSVAETALLVECIDRFKDIVENKKTDAVATSTKKTAWLKIAAEFDRASNCQSRTVKQLDTKWKGLKQDAKKAYGDDVRYRNATGGGPAPPPISETLQQIIDMLPGQFKRIPCSFDDDAAVNPENLALSIEEAQEGTAPVQQPTISISEVSEDTEPHMVIMETPKVEPPLKRPRRIQADPTPTQAPIPMNKTDSLLDLRRSTLLEEHELKMELMKKEHSLKTQAIEEEIKAWKMKAAYYEKLGLQQQVQPPPPTPTFSGWPYPPAPTPSYNPIFADMRNVSD